MRLLIERSIAPLRAVRKSRAKLARVVDGSYRAWKIRLVSPPEGLRVVHSSIHGYGVVTTRTFRSGEVVLHGDGVVYHAKDEFDDTYALLLPAKDGGPEFAAEVDEDGDDASMFYDLVDQSRWINHSCDPNTYVDSSWDAATKTIATWWVCTRDIAAGDELTYDYAFCGHLAEACACGAPTCRGLIVDPDPEELVEVPAHLRHHLRVEVVAQAVAQTGT